MRHSPALQIEEISGDRYADLSDAQGAALSLLADNLQAVIRDLLERGVLVNVDGKIIPNPQGKRHDTEIQLKRLGIYRHTSGPKR